MSSVCGHVLHGRQGMNVMTLYIVYIMYTLCLYHVYVSWLLWPLLSRKGHTLIHADISISSKGTLVSEWMRACPLRIIPGYALPVLAPQH